MALTQISTEGIKNGTITGSDLATNVDLVDNQKLRLGTGNDFEIFFNGTNTSLYTNTGDITIQTAGDDIQLLANDDIQLLVAGGVETAVNCIGHGAVELYYDNNKKFETTSTGVAITGGLTATVLSTFSASGSALRLNDGSILRLGNDDADFFLYHDGSSTDYISAGTGKQLRLTTDDFIIKGANNTETLITAGKDGSVDLYYDNSKKFETTNTGATVTGNLVFGDNGELRFGDDTDLRIYHYNSNNWINTVNGTLEFARNGTAKFGMDANGHLSIYDNVKALFGNSDDLQIYHDGSNSYVQDTGTGNLKLLGSTVQIGKSDNSELGLIFTSDGSIELRHNNSKKLETTSGGIDLPDQLQVDGTVFATGGLKINADSTKLRLGAGDDLQIYHDGTSSYLSNTTGNLYIEAKAGETAIQIIPDGAVDLRYNGSKKLETTSNGATCTGWLQGTQVYATDYIKVSDNDKFLAGNDDDLQIYHNGSQNNNWIDSVNNHDMIVRAGTANLYLQGSDVYIGNEGAGKKYIDCHGDGAVELYYDNSKKFETASYGVQVTGELRANDDIRIQSDYPRLFLTDTDNNNDYSLINNNGNFLIYDDTNNGYRMRIDGSTGTANMHWNPASNNSFDLGTTSLRWRNVYTNDLNLSNEGGANDVDGTWGSYTIQEGEDNLFLINNRNGKMFKFMLQEVIT